MDLQVPVHRLLADAAGRLALGIETVGQVGDRLLEALRDGREVLFVAGDQGRVGLGGEALGKVERTGSQEFTSSAPIERQLRGHPRPVGADRIGHGGRSCAGLGGQGRPERGRQGLVVGVGPSWAAPMPSSATRAAHYG